MGGVGEEVGIDFAETPRDLLIFVIIELKNLRKDFNDERAASKEREAKYEGRLKQVEKDVESLRMSRAQLIAGSGVMGAVMAALMKVFWPR